MTRRPAAPQCDVHRDARLCLDEVARIAFPDGTVSARTLRAEAARGKLAIFKIGKIYYTTLAEIDRMVEQCHVLPKVRISISVAGPDAPLNGQSGTEAVKSARAALQATMAGLKNGPPQRDL